MWRLTQLPSAYVTCFGNLNLSPSVDLWLALNWPSTLLSHCQGEVQALSISLSLPPQNVLAFWLSPLPCVRTTLPRQKCVLILWSPRKMYSLKTFQPLPCVPHTWHVSVEPLLLWVDRSYPLSSNFLPDVMLHWTSCFILPLRSFKNKQDKQIKKKKKALVS